MLYSLIVLIMAGCAIVEKPCNKYVYITNITCVKDKCVILYNDKSRFYLPEQYARLLKIGDKSCVN